jgi:hypothetical protein
MSSQIAVDETENRLKIAEKTVAEKRDEEE